MFASLASLAGGLRRLGGL